MAFNRPSLQDLITRVEGDFKSGLGLITILRRSFIGILSRVLAGLAHTLFGYISFIELQAFPDTAEIEYLERWAIIWGVQRKVATFSEFIVDITGTNGTTIPANTIYRRADGVEFYTQALVTLAGPTGTLYLIAVVAGKAGQVFVSDTISILSPIAGLNSTATVSSIVIEPEDSESDESLRARLITRIQVPPSGGAAQDYISWALAVPGITRAWIKPQDLGPGTVSVFVVSDDEDPITPSPAKITEVEDYIEARRPVTATVSIFAPALLAITMTIKLKPNNATVQAAVVAELEDLILREAALAGAYKAPGVLHDGKILLSRINEAISIAIDEEDHEITLINGIAPANITPATNQLITLGVITWQAL